MGVDYKLESTLLDRLLLINLIKQLTAKQQATVALRAAGYKHKEIGAIFGMTPASIGFIERHALLRLQQLIREQSNDTITLS